MSKVKSKLTILAPYVPRTGAFGTSLEVYFEVVVQDINMAPYVPRTGAFGTSLEVYFEVVVQDINMAPSSSGPGHLVLIQKIAGSTPAGVTFIPNLPIRVDSA